MGGSARVCLGLGLAVGGVLAALPAWAQGKPCDPSTLECSTAPVALHAESRDALQLANLNTGWMPACPGDPTQHCSDQPIQVQASIAFTPLDSGAPTYSFDMAKSSIVQARWPTPDAIELTLAEGTAKDGTFKVAHGLTASFKIWIDSSVFKGEISINAAQLLAQVTGGPAFSYTALNTTKFAPWGFDSTGMKVPEKEDTDLTNSKLFGISFVDLGRFVEVNNVSDYITGTFSINAVTNSTFTYHTTSVAFMEASGQITKKDGTTKAYGIYENALDLTVAAKGKLQYSGAIELKPVVTVTGIGTFPLPEPGLSIPIDFVTGKIPYDSGEVDVHFANQFVHIPLPNVFVPAARVYFGIVDVDSEAQNTVTVENTGELDARVLEVTSSDPAFTPEVTEGTIDKMGGTLDIPITFRPTEPGKVTATITVRTNDPDSPEQSFEVRGGEKAPDKIPDGEDPGQEDGGTTDPAGTSEEYVPRSQPGCHCRAGASGPGMGAGMLFLAGATIGLGRRRRSRRV